MRTLKWTFIVAVALTLASCQTVERGSVAVGDHRICEPDDSGHFREGEVLTIGKLGADLRPTEVTFPDKSVVVLATARKSALVGARTFANTEHFVRIRPDPDYRKEHPRGACKSNNVHSIELCERQPDGRWRCEDGIAHYGHAHSDPID